jgi:hypothetical protein
MGICLVRVADENAMAATITAKRIALAVSKVKQLDKRARFYGRLRSIPAIIGTMCDQEF